MFIYSMSRIEMFYVNPPKGKIALHLLENSVFTRLEYLKLLESDNTDTFGGNFEYLLENSFFDNIGHFTLRLIAAASKDFWIFWVRTEELLMKQRLNHLSVRQTHRLFRNIVRHLTKRQIDATLITESLTLMCKYFLTPTVFNHLVAENHKTECAKYKCRVSFTAIPDLIRERKVDLRRGYATINCSQWKAAISCLYKNFLLEERKRISNAEFIVSSDPRLSYMSEIIHDGDSEALPEKGNITSKNIDRESQKFPPCMLNLHNSLREKHRLSHQARFHYSLFLKECGMKIEDAVAYWKEEYTKPRNCDSACSHDWQTNEKKFLYGIRHLYGLEGGRKNYKTPNCQVIGTDVPGLRYEGGCPFKHFDATTFSELLKDSIDESQIQSLNDLRRNKPEVACTMFFKMINECDDRDFIISSPVEYYAKGTNTAR